MMLFWPSAVSSVPSAEPATAYQLLFAGKLFETQVAPPSSDEYTPRPDATPANRRPFDEALREVTLAPSELLRAHVAPPLVETSVRPILSPAARVPPSAASATVRISSVPVVGLEAQVTPPLVLT